MIGMAAKAKSQAADGAVPGDLEPPAKDAALREIIGYNLKRTTHAVQAGVSATLKPFELRLLTYSALTVIVANPGLRQSQLADALAVERANVVMLVDELEQRELITRDKVPTDRRAYALHSTLKGSQLQKAAYEADLAYQNRLLADLSPAEVTQLTDSLRKIEKTARGLK